ncbi:5'-nucleotidase [Streptococcus thermophilus]|uniref:5'-nucleotidase n=1 Tax=Streptococcus thermophilus TaxID=1308 RepID=A0A8D6U6X3_STRTR|nr:cell surface ecto-5'-nucleotidase Nt5e [Streptococcus thermophilus]CAD0137595.1 5'-nucleotidase [Streptococcus thermophilus]
MKKKTIVATTLSTLLPSTAILANAVKADEVETSTAVTAPITEVVTTEATTDMTSTAATTASNESATPLTSSTSVITTSTAETSVAPVATANETATATASPATPAVVTNASASDNNDTVTFLHTNDVHGHIVEDDHNGVIGDALLSGIVNDTRSKGITLVFDSGDSFQGLPISNSSKGEDMAAVMNAVGFDAMTVGNHEFDFGLDQLRRLSKQINFPIITSNVYVNGVRLFQPSTIVDKTPGIDGDEVVVIGVTTPETATKTHPRNLPGVSFTNPITEVKDVVDQVESNARAEGKDYETYIVLAHLGIDTTTPVDWRGSTLEEALSNYAPLKGKRVLVLDGHSHTLHTATYGDNVTYNQTGSYLNNVGRVVYNSDRVLSYGVITHDEAKKNYQVNPTVKAMIDDIQAKYKAESSKVVIDNSPVKLSGDRMDVRVRETNLGNAVADALLDYGQSAFTHKSNLAVTNGGGLRETIAKDKPITKGDIIAVLPFGNSVAQIQVTGQNIYDMFVKSLGSILQVDESGKNVFDENGQPLLEPSGGFLQVAGGRVYYDTTLPTEKRILSIDILDPETGVYKPLNITETYYLVTNDFLAAGGDGFTMLGGPREEGPSLDTVFADYLTRSDLTKYEVINPNSRTISISSADFAALNKKENAEDTTVNPVNPVDSTVASKVSEKTKPVVSKVVTTPNGKVFFVSISNETLKETEKVTETSNQTEELPTTGDKASHAGLLGLGMLLTIFGLSGKHKGKEKN